MREDRDLIQQYLDQLRLSLRIPEVGRILVEAEDHLRDAAAAGMATGLTETEAQRAAIADFGPVRSIVYAHQTRHGRLAAVLADVALALWRVAACYLLVLFAFGLGDLLAGIDTFNCAARRSQCPGPVAGPGTSPLAADVVWVAMGVVGAAMFAVYFTVRHVRRSRGRVWLVPLGGYFPLTAAIASVAVGIAVLVLRNAIHVAVPEVGLIVYAALGLVVTYGLRMWRMLWDQARGRDELA
jgi:hypothetical protein